MEWLLASAMCELDDEALGWFSRCLSWGSYGMLVRALLTVFILGVALARWCCHYSLLIDDIYLQVGQLQGVASLQLIEQCILGAVQEFAVVLVLCNVLGVACWLIDSRIFLLQTTLWFVLPFYVDSYCVLFDGFT